jgi:glycerophosphoryl diester phosphodiesterase
MPLLLGHRGSRATTSIPENTLASFDLALEHGCDGFEFDVRLTGDGRAVICHDPQIGGITVEEANSSQLLHLPLLSDVLQRYSGRAFLDIELKVPGLESTLLTTLREHTPAKDYVVSSFLSKVILELKPLKINIPIGIICEKALQLRAWHELPVDYVNPHFSLVTRKLVQELHNAGKKLLTWTVNDRDSMLRLADWGVDGIISDDTMLLTQTFGKKL